MSELPKGWQIVSLGEIGYVQSGIGFPNEYQGLTSGDYPVYKVGDVSRGVTQNNGKLQSANNYVTSDTAKLLKGQIFEAGSTLFAKIGEALKLNRRGFVVRAGLADNNVMGYTPEENVNNLFIHYFLRTQDFAEYSRSTTIPSIRKGDIEEIRLALPPSHEQTRIAQKLDELLAQVDTLKARIDAIPALLKRFRRSLLDDAVSGRLTEEWRLNQPSNESWPEVTIGDIVNKIEAGKNLKCIETPPKDDEYGIIKISAVTWGKYNEFQSKTLPKKGLFLESRRIKNGDFLISRANTLQLLGNPVIVERPTKNLMLSDKVLRLVMPDQKKMWMKIFLTSSSGRREIESRATGNQLSMRNIGQKDLLEIPIPNPSQTEVAEIVRRVEQLFAFADQLEAKVASAKTRIDHLTQSILAKAFRGELVPQDPNDEPASVLLERIKAQRAAAPKAKRGRKASV
jgi:type I restriction enzyme S subunit